MDYYVEMQGVENIYTEAEKEDPSFIRKLSIRRVTFIKGGSRANMDWLSSKNLSFVRALARVQRQYIEQSVKM